jgi:hypothetical protein
MRLQIEVPTQQLNRIGMEIGRLSGIVASSAADVSYVMAENVKKDVINRYKNTGGVSEATREKRTYGKRTGSWQSISPYASQQALIRSGKLIKLVTHSVRKLGRITRNRVYVRPSVRLPGGTGLSDKVARANEFGEVHTIQITPQMRRYLHWLLAQSGRAVANIGTTEGTYSSVIVARIPARPVWVPAAEALISRHGAEFMSLFVPVLKAKTQLAINFR